MWWTTPTIWASRRGVAGSADISLRRAAWHGLAPARSRCGQRTISPPLPWSTTDDHHLPPCSSTSPACATGRTQRAGAGWSPRLGARSCPGSCGTAGHEPPSSSDGPSASPSRGRIGDQRHPTRRRLRAAGATGRDAPAFPTHRRHTARRNGAKLSACPRTLDHASCDLSEFARTEVAFSPLRATRQARCDSMLRTSRGCLGACRQYSALNTVS
jgi:hypothetical protein